MSGIKDLYVYNGGTVILGSEASVGGGSSLREVTVTSLHVQDGGIFKVDSGHHQNDVEINADTIKVYCEICLVLSC